MTVNELADLAVSLMKPGMTRVSVTQDGCMVVLEGLPRVAPVAPKLDTLEERERRRVIEERAAERHKDLTLYGAAATDDEAP